MRPVDDYAHAPHILLVDDSPADLKLLVQELDKEAYKLTVALNGRQAYARAQSLPRPDLILLDVCMPQMDGYATCVQLKENPRTAHIPIIFVTASSGLDERLKGFRAGAADYVLKPYDPVEVLARIRVHLSRAVETTAGDEAQDEWDAAREPASTPAAAGGPNANLEIQLPRGVNSPTDQTIVLMARRYLSERLSDPPSLKQMARQMGVHERRLTQAFRMAIGKSVKDYLRDERMCSAQKLLHQRQHSVAEIAEMLGFSSPANFAAAFRRHAGCSPLLFRQRSHQEQSVDRENMRSDRQKNA